MPITNAIGEGPYWCTRCQTHHAWKHQEGDFRVFDSELRECCKLAKTFGGSHYHCGRCGRVSSMLGDYTTWCRVRDERTEGHMCCPNDCELDSE